MRLKRFFRGVEAPEAVELATAQAVSYATWRGACEGVAEAYRSWVGAVRTERWLAHAAYVAALDHEEQAARAYQQLVEQVRCTVEGGYGGTHAIKHAVAGG